VGAYSDLTKEKKASYIAALKREKDGYKARIEQLKAVNDDDGAKVIENRVKQVEAELKKVSSAKVVEARSTKRRDRPQTRFDTPRGARSSAARGEPRSGGRDRRRAAQAR
jgi:phosphosulfolactate synthase (CoM biosynthesis protein A)